MDATSSNERLARGGTMRHCSRHRASDSGRRRSTSIFCGAPGFRLRTSALASTCSEPAACRAAAGSVTATTAGSTVIAPRTAAFGRLLKTGTCSVTSEPVS